MMGTPLNVESETNASQLVPNDPLSQIDPSHCRICGLVRRSLALPPAVQPFGVKLVLERDKPGVILPVFYSSRRAFTGSIEAARRAGINPAIAAQIPSATAAPMYADGSPLLTW